LLQVATISSYIIVVGCQIFPSALKVAKEDDADKRLEHLNNLQVKLEELEQHLVTTNKPYFGGV